MTEVLGAEKLAALGPRTTREAARGIVAEAFRAANLASASLDARVLTCAALGIDHAELVREPDQPLGSRADALRDLARRRLCREPVSRIVGHREFFGLRLEIDPDVLDPRPETETLVEAVVDRLSSDRAKPLRILDLGTGSGAILCALLVSFPDAFGVGVDACAGACAVARRNLARSGLLVRAAILCGNWTDALLGRFDVVVSNPPYIRRDEIRRLADEVRSYDPMLALDGGDDGLDAYRALAPRLAPHLSDGGLAAFEIGADQPESVAALLVAAGFEPPQTRLDLAGHARVVLAGLHDAARTWHPSGAGAERQSATALHELGDVGDRGTA